MSDCPIDISDLDITWALDETRWDTIMTAFTRHWPQNKIKGYKSGRSGMLDYIDARDIEDLLDCVVGPQNWSSAMDVIDPTTAAVRCTLTIHGVSKQDFGYPNNPVGTNPLSEPLKEAATDAIKRAAVQWGIGRFLYTDPKDAKRSATEPQQTARPARPEPPKPASQAIREAVGSPRPTEQATATVGAILRESTKAEPAPATSNSGEGVKAASKNQIATVQKLAGLLNVPVLIGEDNTSMEAAEEITRLSNLYNETHARKGAPA